MRTREKETESEPKVVVVVVVVVASVVGWPIREIELNRLVGGGGVVHRGALVDWSLAGPIKGRIESF